MSFHPLRPSAEASEIPKTFLRHVQASSLPWAVAAEGGRPKGGEEIHDHDPILGFAYFMLGKKSKHHILLNGGLTGIYHGAIRKNSP